MVEPISIDEAFLDVTGSAGLFGDGPTIAATIKAAVTSDVGLTASVGVATNKLVAKVASDLRKPDGLVVVPAGEEAAFLAPLPIARLWGVGAKTAVVLADYGVRTIGDLAALSGDVMEGRFGKHGASLAERARGIDTDPVHDGDPAKSVGHEHTFDRDTTDPEIIERTLLAMADGVGGRLRSAGVRAGTIAIRLRDDSFRTISRQRTLDLPTDMTERIYAVALELARPEVAAIRARGGRVRLLGVTGSNLGERDQLALFDADDPRRRKAIEAADAVRHRYGEDAMTRARLLDARLPAPFERDPRNPLDRRARGVPVDPEGAGADPSAAATDRDSQGDTDVDEIPLDDG
jgi:DNA polymerase-4